MTDRYRLPFNTNINEVKISQGRNGPWSHFIHAPNGLLNKGQDLAHAVDFALNPGTPVLAARDGKVLFVYDSSTVVYQGLDPEIGNNLPKFSTNLIVVDHGDGTRAVYSHLAKERSVVDVGTSVFTGDLLSYTGLSGWIGEVPHLHFHVMDRGYVTLPVGFANYSGSLVHSEIFSGNK